MATTKATAPKYIPQEEDPNSPYEGLYHLLRRCIHGHDTTTEAICHYQDVFGHSCYEDLEKASESEYKETFWRLYDEAYGTVAMITFYGQHSRYCRDLRERIEDLEAETEEHKDIEKDLRQKILSRDRDLVDASKTISDLRCEIASLKDGRRKDAEALADVGKEVVRLKARLFDLMEKMEGQK